MAKQNYIKGNLINLFYYEKTGSSTGSWKALAYGQSHSLSMSAESSEISSKDHGLHPDKEITNISWSLSGEYYFTKENADLIMKMANKAETFSFAFAQVKDATSGDSYAATGLKDVTGEPNGAEKWEIGTSTFVRYGNGKVTSCEISSSAGEVGSVSLEITGEGALSESAITDHPYSAS